MKTRAYNLNDIPRIVDLCAVSVPALPNYANINFEPDVLTKKLHSNVNNATFMCLLLEEGGDIHGGLGATCAPMFFSNDFCARDVFFYITPEQRTLRNANLLLDGYVNWALARKCSLVLASHTSGIKEDQMATLLSRHGFDRVGSLFHLRT